MLRSITARVQSARPAAQRLIHTPSVPVVKARDISVRFFKIGGAKNPEAERTKDFALPTSRECYEADDVEQYFNYMGFLANEGSYDRMEQLMAMHEPADVILLLACEEGDTPKVVELLAAGANINVKNTNGKTPLEVATKSEVITLLKEHMGKAKASASA